MPLQKKSRKNQVFHLQDTTTTDDLWSSIYFDIIKYLKNSSIQDTMVKYLLPGGQVFNREVKCSYPMSSICDT